jgi:hypothetical protein
MHAIDIGSCYISLEVLLHKSLDILAGTSFEATELSYPDAQSFSAAQLAEILKDKWACNNDTYGFRPVLDRAYILQRRGS